MAQKCVGHVIDRDGYKIEVWVDYDTNRPSDYEHVYLMYDGSQLEEFQFGFPRGDNPLQLLAQQVAAGKATCLTEIPIDFTDDQVIDDSDVGRPYFKKLFGWSSESKPH